MNKWLWTTVFFWIGWSISFDLYAQEKENQPPMFGLSYDNNKNTSITMGDYNLFNVGEENYSFRRYGGGGGKFELGNAAEFKFKPNLGFIGQGNQGLTLIGLDAKEKTAIFPQVGVEAFNGRIRYNTQANIQDYYEGFFGPSVGVAADIGGCRAMPLVRAGAAVGTLGKTGIVPAANLAYGPAAHFSCEGAHLSYGSLWLYDTSKKYMHDVGIMLDLSSKAHIGFQYLGTKGRWDENYGAVFWRLDN